MNTVELYALFSRGTRAQHLALCGVCLVSPVCVVSGVPCEIRVTDCVQCTLALPDPDIDTDITITTNTTDTDTDTNTNTYTNTDTDTNINTKTYTETFLSQVFQLGF